MKRGIVVGVIMCCMICVSLLAVGATPGYARSILLKDADNSVCPVTGDPITEKRFNSGYSGKRYWFSTYAAVLKFDENPDYYMSKFKDTKSPARATSTSNDDENATKTRSWRTW